MMKWGREEWMLLRLLRRSGAASWSAENDNGVEADAEREDRAVLLGPLHVGVPGVLLGKLVNIADQREASGTPAIVVVDCYDGEEEDGDEVEHLRVLGLRYCP
jgi:hypothetical protein